MEQLPYMASHLVPRLCATNIHSTTLHVGVHVNIYYLIELGIKFLAIVTDDDGIIKYKLACYSGGAATEQVQPQVGRELRVMMFICTHTSIY